MTNSPRSAILLAAGCSRRLKLLTADRPKCLLEIGGRTLLEHQVGALRAAGVERIVVVTGYFADKVRDCGGPALEYVHNPVYDRTNSLYSLSLALDHGQDGFVLANADVLFHPRILEYLVLAPFRDALLYEPGIALGDEEMKVRLEDGRVSAIAKDLPAGSYHGENLGVLKFSAEGAARVAAAARQLVALGEVNAWAPRAFHGICADYPIHAVPTRGLPWIEIDFPEDVERARAQVWPRIERDLVHSRERESPLSAP